ncbi:Hypothetical predicted protein [Olea europaea subsp. europaea]|uniref:Uncharacterized protein n=1 Tax=Olea europaea subsp. europaea TaxID=158383 RepID=A0A8S0QJK7_OLEEU|nr:Hypothetical predicted protein [Olea europaea subsp. europaea]
MVLSRKVKSIEDEKPHLHKERDMLKESTCQLYSKEQVLQIQSDLKTIHDALDRANEELCEKLFEEKETPSQLVEEKYQRIYDLLQLVASLEQEFESLTYSFSSQLTKVQVERNSLRESWEEINTAEVLKEMEIQEKNLIITELEHDLNNFQQRVEEQERSLFCSRKKRGKIEAELEAKQLEIYKLKYELKEKQLSSDTTIEKLNDEKVKKLVDFSDQENLFNNTMGLLSNKIQKLSVEDYMQLMEILRRIVQMMENNGLRIEINGDDNEYDPVKENLNIFLFPLMKKAEAIHDRRSPLRVLNN